VFLFKQKKAIEKTTTTQTKNTNVNNINIAKHYYYEE